MLSLCEIQKDEHGNELILTRVKGIQLLRLILLNKGTAFSEEERRELGLEGLLPPRIGTLERQLERAYKSFKRQPTPLLKYQFLRSLQERHEILLYALVAHHLEEMLPIVYTPTVGEAVQQFSSLYETPRGLSFCARNIDRARECVENYPFGDVRMVVATDSSAILGIGDQGYGGLAISIGKLNLYTVGGGVSPYQSMPVSLDVGTDREDLIDDPMYLGLPHLRLRGDEYIAFMDRFVEALKGRWPRAIVQWEDLAKETAFQVLERYRKSIPSFNDDIQGTGAVTLAGVISACRLKDERFEDQRFLVYGAGAGGVGVASVIRQHLLALGLSEDQARERIFVLDSKGLLLEDRPVEPYKQIFQQRRAAIAGWQFAGKAPNLEETIEQGKVTVLLGLSGQPGSFSPSVVQKMSSGRPVVFPLSNPTSLSEGLPEEILRATEGRAIVATGSPFDPVVLNGTTHPIGQGNNAFIFPGLGLGSIVAEVSEITDGMVLEAAYALAHYTEQQHPGRVFPPVSELREVSRRVAARVIRRAMHDGVARAPGLDQEDLDLRVERDFWYPKYLPMRYVGP